MRIALQGGHVLTVPQAARKLGVDPKTVRNRIHAGELAATRTGHGAKSQFRIKDEDLADFERALMVGAPAA
jgi:excisionase family DNA binding protein